MCTKSLRQNVNQPIFVDSNTIIREIKNIRHVNHRIFNSI